MSRAAHMLVFLGIFALIIVSSHFYFYTRIGSYLQLTGGQRRLLAITLGSLAVLMLAALPLSRVLPREAATALAWIAFPWMGFTLLLLVALVITDTAWLGLQATASETLQDPSRRRLIQTAFGIAALSATGLLGGFSLWNGLRRVQVKTVSVTLARLPKSLDGLRIVQLTDIHIGPLVQDGWLQDVVRKVNALKPDLIAVTGDLVDGSVADLSRLVAPIADLQAPLGVYFITGNHEYYSGAEAWCAHVASLGLRVLRNERVSIATGPRQESFDLAGTDDWSADHDLPKALAGRDPNKALVLLAHQPVAVDEAATHGVDLQLAGHTHGGQIWPFNYLVYLQQPYVKGLHRHRDTATQIYVSEGTGFWGPPMRFGTAAEITHITLRASV